MFCKGITQDPKLWELEEWKTGRLEGWSTPHRHDQFTHSDCKYVINHPLMLHPRPGIAEHGIFARFRHSSKQLVTRPEGRTRATPATARTSAKAITINSACGAAAPRWAGPTGSKDPTKEAQTRSKWRSARSSRNGRSSHYYIFFFCAWLLASADLCAPAAQGRRGRRGRRPACQVPRLPPPVQQQPSTTNIHSRPFAFIRG